MPDKIQKIQKKFQVISRFGCRTKMQNFDTSTHDKDYYHPNENITFTCILINEY